MTVLTDELRKAALAAIRNPAIIEALDAMERDVVEQWAATGLSDAHEREISYFRLLGLRQLRQQLINWSRETKGTGDK